MLLDHSRKHSLLLWSELGSKLQKVVVLKSGDLDAGLRLLPADVNHTAEPNFNFLILLSEQVEALAHAGQIADALTLVEAGIERSEADWLTPELLRLKGELLFRSGPAAAKTAEDFFRLALDEAQRQEALSWELRASTSLAQLLRDQDRFAEVLAILQPVYERFTEGFDTADLRSAKALLGALGRTASETTPDAAGPTPVRARSRASPVSAVRGLK